MAKGINKVTLIGNVGQDPESKFTPSGAQVVTLSLATTRSWKDKQTGQKQEETEWHRITMWGKLAEITAQYVKKGSQLYIEGRLKTTMWEKDGIKRYSTGIIADNMQMLGGRPDGAGQPPVAEPPQGAGPDFDDDIPF